MPPHTAPSTEACTHTWMSKFSVQRRPVQGEHEDLRLCFPCIEHLKDVAQSRDDKRRLARNQLEAVSRLSTAQQLPLFQA